MQSFDACLPVRSVAKAGGRNRHPDDWNYTNIPTVPSWLYRGYTGHEHHPEFALVNMNGRMYDPVVGRMLSPDVNLQAPDYSQNHNRYSYALNNPLKFTDPSGNAYDWMGGSSWSDYSTSIDLANARNFGSDFADTEFDRDHFRGTGSKGFTYASGDNFSHNPTWTGRGFSSDLPVFNGSTGTYGIWDQPSVPSFPLEGVDYSATFIPVNGISDDPIRNKGKYGYLQPRGYSLGDFVNSIYSNAVKTRNDVYPFSVNELSGFALQSKKTGEIRFWINSQTGNTRSKSYNYTNYVRKQGYKILFQVHSHIISPPSDEDINYQHELGAEVYIITSDGDIWKTYYSKTLGKTGEPIGDVVDYFQLLGVPYNIKK